MLKTKIPHIAISIGDFNGIGPEIILKSLSEMDLRKSIPVITAPKTIIQHYGKLFFPQQEFHFITDHGSSQEGKINVLQLNHENPKITPGVQSAESGKVAMLSIEKSIELCLKRKADAIVTAPISKEAVNLAGYNIPGHTEFLAMQTNTKNVLMMLVNDTLRVALVTAHVPIKEITDSISADLIKTKVQILADSLRIDFGIEQPKIAVLGLNPHAGDGGVIGMEEIEIIDPVLKEIRDEQNQFTVHGPFPADGFFGRKLYKKHDAILAMYHDQGLAPFKLLSFGKGVNFTAGLPIIRTSPDHGTAFDIAGKGIADPSSFKEAYKLAVKLAKK